MPTRQTIGHWEGDIVVGKRGGSHVGTLVERSTRFVVLLHLPDGAGSDSVVGALAAAVDELPRQLRRSITWDRGIEMTRHQEFTARSNVPVYFCDARSAWQRGSSENTKSLLRQYLPRGTDLSICTARDLRAIAEAVNNRPRRVLSWKTPFEALMATGAMTA